MQIKKSAKMFLLLVLMFIPGLSQAIVVEPGCRDIAKISRKNEITTAINCEGFIAYAWTEVGKGTVQVAITEPGKKTCKSLGNALIQPGIKLSTSNPSISVGVDKEKNIYVAFFATSLDEKEFFVKVSRFNAKCANGCWEDFSKGLHSKTDIPLVFLTLAVNDAGDSAIGWSGESLDRQTNFFKGAVFNQIQDKWVNHSIDYGTSEIPTVKVVMNSKGIALYLIELLTVKDTSFLQAIVLNASKCREGHFSFPDRVTISDPNIQTDLQVNAITIDAEGDCIALWHSNVPGFFYYNTYSFNKGTWHKPKLEPKFNQPDLVFNLHLAVDQTTGNAGAIHDAEDAFLFANAYNKKTNQWTNSTLLTENFGFVSGFVVDNQGIGIAIWKETQDSESLFKTVAFPDIKKASFANPIPLKNVFPSETNAIALSASLKSCGCNPRSAVALSSVRNGKQIILQSNFFENKPKKKAGSHSSCGCK